MAYEIGFDCGTNSLGWAVLEENGELCRFHGKDMYGSIIDFSNSDGKNPNEVRRTFRSQRRRLQRRRQRILWLQSLMGPLVAEKDPDLFRKLSCSYMSEEDERFDFDSIIHTDRGGFGSLNYHKEYPTIYHLRKALMSDKEFDIRLIYLALHHIITNRGNFLYEGQNLSLKNFRMEEDVTELMSLLSFNRDLSDAGEVTAILAEKTRKGIKKENLMTYLTPLYEADEGSDSNSIRKAYVTAVANLILGYKADFSKINGAQEKLSLSVAADLTDDVLGKLTDDDMILIDAFSKVHSGFIIMNLISGDGVETVSDCYINRFREHGKDLVALKNAVRRYVPEDYRTVINSTDVDRNGKTPFVSYALYMKNPSKYKLDDQKESLYTTIRTKLLDNTAIVIDPKDADISRIRDRMEEGSFLLKPRNPENGALPYQFNAEEMALIIDSQSRFHPGLASIRDRMLSIVEFRIPYFVGPLQKSSPFAWLERSDEKITPWNFSDVVDFDSSEQKFIKRMTGKCTELLAEDVLPRCSPLYEHFTVLNELANIRIDGMRLSAETKRRAADELFLANRKVSKKIFREWLETEGAIPDAKTTITGFADEKGFLADRSFEISMRAVLGERYSSEMAEDIAEVLTVFSSRERTVAYIKRNYPEVSDRNAEKLARIRCTGWGRFSRKLLTGLYSRTSDGTPVCIMNLMQMSEKNFMEIKFSPEYNFNDIIQKENSSLMETMTIQSFLQDYPVSPGARHMAYIAYKAAIDIIKAKGGELPSAVYIETADGEDIKSKRRKPSSRYDSLVKLFDELKNDPVYDEIRSEIKALPQADRKDLKMKYLLYFRQNGKSLYSGKPLGGIENLSMCQIDHIVPQCYVKDNSIDNLALVFSSENQRKKDSLLLSEEIIARMSPYWKDLYDAKLISRKKFENLIRTEISEKDMDGFINRQLVETRQETKLLMYVLRMLGIQEVYGVSAKLSSNIRKRYSARNPELIKIREVNDCHHADDAWLAARAGHFIQKQFSPNRNSFIMEFYRSILNDEKRNVEKYGILAYIFGHDFRFWNGTEEIMRMTHVFNGRSYFMRYCTMEDTGQFYNQTKMKRGKGHIPLSKEMDHPDIYGGYSNDNAAYFLITSDRKGKLRLTGIPIRIAAFRTEEAIDVYLKENGLSQAYPRKICKYQQIKYKEKDGRISDLMIVGEKEVINARQLHLTPGILHQLKELMIGDMSDNDAELKTEKVYDDLLSHLSTYACFGSIYEKLSGLRDNYDSLDPEERMNCIRNLLTMMHANSTRVESGAWKMGKVPSSRLSGKTIDIERTMFVDKSVTGLQCVMNSYGKKKEK